MTECEDLDTRLVQPVGRASGQTVLIVEDEPAIRDITERILARNGFWVLSAPDGPTAVQVADAHPGPIDLLVTDVVMPRMLGLEVAERVAAIRPDIRIVFMSGYTSPTLDASLAPGAIVVEKPFSEGTLLAKVTEALER